ncbi:Uu.00g091790.m01.CDS01 [Anthostomella pinea]|uniref:Uu.00g091790.m01.CDS01 n=1 Tax=Anthostomella pinea TaxID=933095 RepID=A0AAI8VN85_9PEZI|nr:Uu.00g091790.m01.CDS01 [Anthostomella pinea]
MPASQIGRRHHSLPSGHEAVEGISRTEGRSRVELSRPRSRSTTNVNVFDSVSHASRHGSGSGSMRELEEFCRTTGPAPKRNSSPEARRLGWSIQGLRKPKRTRSQPPDIAVPETTACGHRYIAISTPIPKHHYGPWFQSQYPVFPLGPSAWDMEHQKRPETTLATGPAGADARGASLQTQAGYGGDGPGQQPCPRPSSMAALEEGNEPPGPSERTLPELGSVSDGATVVRLVDHGFAGQDRDPKLLDATETPLQRSKMVRWEDEDDPNRLQSTAQPLETSPSLDYQRPEVIGTPSTSLATSLPHEQQWPPLGRSSHHGPPRPSRLSSRKPSNVSIHSDHSTLAVPREYVLPESPGFPNMLATMTFPEPPKSSRSPSSVNDIGMHAFTSVAAHAAPSGQVHMQERQVRRSPNTPDMPGLASKTKPARGLVFPFELGQTVPPRCAVADKQPRQLAVAAAAAPSIAFTSNGHEYMGIPTTPTERHQKSDTTRGSSRQSNKSGVGSFCAMAVATSERTEQQGNVSRSDTRTSTSTISHHDPEHRSQGIGVQRMVRKAKVRHYKKRDLDATRSRALDSPVLGRFPGDALRALVLSQQESSGLTQGPRRPSTRSVDTSANQTAFRTHGQAINEPLFPASTRDLQMTTEPEKQRRTSPAQLTVSPIMGTGIQPQCPAVAAMMPTDEITMSPIMVVANVASSIGSSTDACTLRRLSLVRPDTPAAPTPPPRSANRPKPLKITISRNPSTGAIERTTSADYRLNRHSLIVMPTSPLSPGVLQSPRRMSFPPKHNSHAQLRELSKPALEPRRQDWHEQENRWRNAALKERVIREKLEKEKEISDIVTKTVGLPPKQAGCDEEPATQYQEQHTAEKTERQLKRLEKINGAWLQAMKPLLEKMGRTLDDMRADGTRSGLTMSDFIVDMQAEARRFSCYSQQVAPGDAAQELSLEDSDSGGRPLRPPILVASEDRTPHEREAEARAAVKRRMRQQEAMMDNLLERWGLPSPRAKNCIQDERPMLAMGFIWMPDRAHYTR